MLGKPTVEVPAAEDFFNQQEDPQGFFDNLPEQPLQPTTSLGATAGHSTHAGAHAVSYLVVIWLWVVRYCSVKSTADIARQLTVWRIVHFI
jgi:hypothetical protein